MREKRKGKNLKKLLLVLLIILVSLISFMGVYVKDANKMVNLIPEYIIGSDLNGYRVVRIKLDDATNDIIKDKDGNVISNITEEIAKDAEGNAIKDAEGNDITLTEETMGEYGYTKIAEPVNKEENKTKENYLLARKIISKRLEDLKVSDYKVRQDVGDGSMIIEIKSDSNTDDIVSNLIAQGKFEIQDSQTKEVLLNNDDIKEVKFEEATSSISINFDKEGTEKFKKITEEYREEATETNESTESKKQVSIVIDGNSQFTTGFTATIIDGVWRLSVGNSSSTTNTNNNVIKPGQYMAAMLDNGCNPFVYKLDSNRYIQTASIKDTAKIVVIVIAVVIGIMLLGLIFKFKMRGLFAVISHIGFNAILLILTRWTNVELGLGGLIALALVQLINYMMLVMMLKEDSKKAIIKFAYRIIPAYIISIVFTFNSFLPIYSFGMVIFWAITIAFIYNAIITRNLIEE